MKSGCALYCKIVLHSSFLVIHFQQSFPLNDFYFSFLAKLQT